MALCSQEHSDGEESTMEVCDAEILDEYTTSRGELKLRTSSTFSDDRRYMVRNLHCFHLFSCCSWPTVKWFVIVANKRGEKKKKKRRGSVILVNHKSVSLMLLLFKGSFTVNMEPQIAIWNQFTSSNR